MALAKGSFPGRLLLLVVTWTVCLHLSECVISREQPEFCRLPQEVGRCKARMGRFFYNTTSQRCEKFYYGGCGGNANNFETMTRCQSACVCFLYKRMGYWGPNGCRQQLKRYWFSLERGCRASIYTGCGGNGNNFESKQQCRDSCALNQCYAPKEIGPCSSKSYVHPPPARYFYNAEQNRCEKFTYNGCNRKRENSFRLQRDCEDLCVL